MRRNGSSGIRSFLVLLLNAFLVACSSLPPYEGPSAEHKESAATIENSGDKFSCGPVSQYPRICEAGVNVIDGKKAAFFGPSMQADPGPHRLQLLCMYQRTFAPTSKVGFFRVIDVVLMPKVTYMVQAREENNVCRLSLIDARTGMEVESKDVRPPATTGVQ